MQEHSGLSARTWQIVSAVLILTTLAAGYAVTESPRSLFVWTTIVFLCVVELAIGVTFSLRSGGAGKVSSAMASIISTTVGVYAVVGFGTIWILGRYVRGVVSNFDNILITALAVETVLFVLAAVLLHQTDLSVQPRDIAATQANRQAADKGAQITEFVHLLRSMKPKDLEESQRIESLVKGFESCGLKLKSSYRTLSPEVETQLAGTVSQLDVVAPLLLREGLNPSSFENVENILRDLESSTRRLMSR